MPLTAGSKLGPYEIAAAIGAGGMGEVYRARDPRLGRDVAIKVLPSAFARDPDRLSRFEQEARAAGNLNHPNVVSIHDLGSHDGAPYVVMELLEGHSLRERISGGALPPRKALDLAAQIAAGLAAAHQKGIVHRDLKPENIFVTSDGRAKILDFGLAKLSAPDSAAVGSLATAALGTQPGSVLGTVGYMAPEQVRGEPADARADIFAFGAVLYEMFSGNRAFRRASAPETLTAILRDEPPDFVAVAPGIPPALDRIVRHCLEKRPEDRFQSSRDLAFDLETLASYSGSGVGAPAPGARPAGAPRRWPGVVKLALLAAAAGALGYLAARGEHRAGTPPSFHRVTFRRGNVIHARFAPDGQNIVYSAAWADRPAELFSTRREGPESRPLGLERATILAISRGGEMAITRKSGYLRTTLGAGTLSRVPLAGGAPRPVLENVVSADWTPDGKDLAVVHEVEGRSRIEFPVGQVLLESPGTIAFLRFSPGGERLAFMESIGGVISISTVDRQGVRATWSSGWSSGSEGLVWSADGKEIWFTGSRAGEQGLYAVDPKGRVRALYRGGGSSLIHDLAADGSALFEFELTRFEIAWKGPGEAAERDLSWFDGSVLSDLSPDARSLLFSETQDSSGPLGSIYLRATSGEPAVRLGDGIAQALSPDGRHALAIVSDPAPRLVLQPIGPGSVRFLERGGLEQHQSAAFLPDGSGVLTLAAEKAGPIRLYRQPLAGGSPAALGPPALAPISPGNQPASPVSSPDGKFVVVNAIDHGLLIVPTAGGEPRPIPDTTGLAALRWSTDGASLYAWQPGELPARIFQIDLATGAKSLWKELMPADPAGVVRIDFVQVTPDGQSYAYTYLRISASDLYVVQGWR